MPAALLDIRNPILEVDRPAILDQLDMAVQAGEIHALLGVTESGRTAQARFLFVRMALVLLVSPLYLG